MVKRHKSHVVGISKLIMPADRKLIFDFLRERADEGQVAAVRDLVMLEVLMGSGIREAELCGLRVMDTPVVLGGDCIEIIKGAKGGRRRVVWIDDELSKLVVWYVKEIRQGTLPRHVRRGDITRAVFYSADKRPYKTVGVYWKVRRIGQKAGVKKRLTPHMFRHSYATYALSAKGDGSNLKMVQQQLGHSNIATTEKYLHLIQSLVQPAANAMGLKAREAGLMLHLQR